MSDRTAIEWTHRPGTRGATWNPWYGCTHVSEGCDNCYMFREMRRYGRDPQLVAKSKTKFHDPLKWSDPCTIFTCSWGDWFHKAADDWRPAAWDIVDRTRIHTYLVLTKRIGRARRHLPPNWGAGYDNVELGSSVELQRHISRVDQLIDTPARRRFLSCEPLLGPLDIRAQLATGGIHWVIVGGESEIKEEFRREMDLAWMISLVDQCREADVPVFVKQDSGAVAGLKGRIPDEYWIKEFPKAVAA